MMQAPILGDQCRERLGNLRRECNSWREVAERLQVNVDTLNSIRLGRRRVGMDAARRLRDGLNLNSIDEVFH